MSYKAKVSRMQLLLKRLKLFNNQRRDQETVGDNTLFEVFQSVFSVLYNDELTSEFVGRLDAHKDKADGLNNVAKFDYDEMEMPVVNYEWDWDTLFFGSGYLQNSEFDRERMVPVPEVWDPMTMLHDPDATSVNGFRSKNAARFFGREIMIRRVDAEELKSVFDLDLINTTRPRKSLFEIARQSREDAQGLNNQIKYDEALLKTNARLPIIEWYTWWKDDEYTGGKAKKVMVWLGNDMQKICRFKVIENKRWPLIHRKLFAQSHQWDSVSISDLIEDKQRLKATLMNLGVKMMKSDLFGMYIYDKNKVKNKGDLNFDIDKMVPVELKQGENIGNVIHPMPKASPNLQLFNWIMTIISSEAGNASGISASQPSRNPKGGKKTATQQSDETSAMAGRLSLTSKGWGWSEKEFWKSWYEQYKTHFKSYDEKLVRINSIYGYQYKYFTKDDFVSADFDPDVFIKSRLQSEQERMTSRNELMQFGQLLGTAPGTNMRYFIKKAGRLSKVSEQEMERLLPPTPDEVKAKYENADLEDDKQVSISPEDNHEQHLEVHAKGEQTHAMIVHVITHQHAMELQKTRPDLFPGQQQGQDPAGALPGQDPAGAQQTQNMQKQFGKGKQAPQKGAQQRPQMGAGRMAAQ